MAESNTLCNTKKQYNQLILVTNYGLRIDKIGIFYHQFLLSAASTTFIISAQVT
jgi:hypothetical protein